MVTSNVPFSLYVHVPYCTHKCPYCDFNTFAVRTVPEREYLETILAELAFRAEELDWLRRPVQSLFFGGGTPSLLSGDSVRAVIDEVRARFPLSPDAEISLESNPGTLSPALLDAYRAAGVNRLSIGAQSFHDDRLTLLGRTHSSEDAQQAVALARASGISNVSVDLMYGTPGQTVHELLADLEAAVTLPITHLSVYSLTIEKGTPFGQSFGKGILKLPPEDEVVEMMELLESFLPRHSFERYEISNFAHEARFRSRHNLAYWSGEDYLGIGPGAHSFLRTASDHARRWANFAAPGEYRAAVMKSGRADSWRDTLVREDLVFEFFFTGLRKIEGVSRSEFLHSFGVEPEDLYTDLIPSLVEGGLMHRAADKLRLTPRGLQLYDSVLERFVLR